MFVTLCETLCCFKHKIPIFFKTFKFTQFFYVASLKTTCHKVVDKEFNIVFFSTFPGSATCNYNKNSVHVACERHTAHLYTVQSHRWQCLLQPVIRRCGARKHFVVRLLLGCRGRTSPLNP